MTPCTVFVSRITHLCLHNEQLTAAVHDISSNIRSVHIKHEFFCMWSFSPRACSCPYFHLFAPTRATVPKTSESSRTWSSLWLQTMPSLMSSRVFTLWNQAAPPDGSPDSPGSPCASLSTPTGGGKQARDPHLSRKRKYSARESKSKTILSTKTPLMVNRAVRRRDESLWPQPIKSILKNAIGPYQYTVFVQGQLWSLWTTLKDLIKGWVLLQIFPVSLR